MNLLTQEPQSTDSSYIPLVTTQGHCVKIDASDYYDLMQFKWQSRWDQKSKSFRVERNYWDYSISPKKCRTVIMSRQIMDAAKGVEVDHRNHDTLDNRRCNLRLATHAENSRNRRRRSDNTSGQKGVKWNAKLGKWSAGVNFNGTHYYLGVFAQFDEAKAAYKLKALSLHGEFAHV